MAKILIVILVTILLVLWFKSMARRDGSKDRPREKGVEDMVRCQVCGVNMPRSEAILSKGRFYCGEAHRLKDQSKA